MASIRRHPENNSWQVRYRDPSGKQRTKAFKRQIDAKHFAAEVEADKQRGTYIDPYAGKQTFEEYARRWQATRTDKSVATQDREASQLRSLILPVFGHRPIASVTPSDIHRWLAELNRADSTRTKALQIIRNVYRLAVADRAVTLNPAASVRTPGSTPERESIVLTDEETDRLIEAAEEVDETSAPLVWLMVRGGLRIGEAIALHRTDVDLATGMLTVARSMNRSGEVVPVKGRRRESEGRTLPMPVDLQERLGLHLRSTQPPLSNLLVTGPRSAPIRYTNWRSRQWVEICGLAQIEATPHDLRRTCATRLIREDRWSPAEVQTFLGHRDARITLDIYTHIHADDLPKPSSIAR